jgi:hypothetical protein
MVDPKLQTDDLDHPCRAHPPTMVPLSSPHLSASGTCISSCYCSCRIERWRSSTPGLEDQGRREEGEPPSHKGILLDPNSAVVCVMLEGCRQRRLLSRSDMVLPKRSHSPCILAFLASFCLLNVYASMHKLVLLGVIEKEVDNGSVYLPVSMVP